jgi:hypothetical protein
MRRLKRERARQLFKKSGIKYLDLTRKDLQRLRNIINAKMVASEVIEGTLRCRQRPYMRVSAGRPYGGIRCRSFYFDDREVVTFNPDGFLGFAGWAADGNVQPILHGFVEWLKEMESDNAD